MKHITLIYILSSFNTQLRTCISFCFPFFRSLVVPLYPTKDFPKLHFCFPPFPSLIVHSYPTTYLQTHFPNIFPSYQNFFPTTDSSSSVCSLFSPSDRSIHERWIEQSNCQSASILQYLFYIYYLYFSSVWTLIRQSRCCTYTISITVGIDWQSYCQSSPSVGAARQEYPIS